jgi:hypothetical protein
MHKFVSLIILTMSFVALFIISGSAADENNTTLINPVYAINEIDMAKSTAGNSSANNTTTISSDLNQTDLSEATLNETATIDNTLAANKSAYNISEYSYTKPVYNFSKYSNTKSVYNFSKYSNIKPLYNVSAYSNLKGPFHVGKEEASTFDLVSSDNSSLDVSENIDPANVFGLDSPSKPPYDAAKRFFICNIV